MGLKFLIPLFFWVGTFGKYFFGWLDLRRDFLGYNQNNLTIRVSAYPGRVVLRIKYNQTCFAAVLLLGVLSDVRMTTRCGKDNFRWYDE